MTYLLGPLTAGCLIVPLVFAAFGAGDKRRALRWSLLFLALLILDAELLYLPSQSGVYHIFPFRLHWNWFGKALELAWAILFLVLGPITFTAAGFRKPYPSSVLPALIVVLLLTAGFFLAHALFLRLARRAPRRRLPSN
ncbi:MAG: hypothetical protein ACRES9_00145 [Gammaproteobacteria bacterium]